MVRIIRNVREFFADEKYPYFIYGCTKLGRYTGEFMNRCQMNCCGYLDQYEASWGADYWGIRVFNPRVMISEFDSPVYNIILTVKDIKSVLLDFWDMDMDKIYNILIPPQFASGKYMNNLLLAPLRNRLLKNKEFTVVSNNCTDRLIYEAVDIPRRDRAPFNNSAFCHEDFLKFAMNFEFYIKQELEFCCYEYQGIMMNRSDVYPVGKLGDIKVHFGHSVEWERVKTTWDKRKKNIHMESMFWIFSDYGSVIKYPIAKAFSGLDLNKCLQLSECMYCLPCVNYAMEKNGTFLDEDSIIEEWFDLLGWLNEEYVF